MYVRQPNAWKEKLKNESLQWRIADSNKKILVGT